jgi:tetratricopeptide (TPR) repeat protein
MAVAIPETGPIIRAAVEANPALLAPNEGGVSLRARMQQLVYAPFKVAVQGEPAIRALARGPLLIVLDGLDECENKDEIQELISGMLLFFNANPLIPLRVFITSRVEEHIQSQLNVPGVMLDNLVDHCSDNDIDTFLQLLFEDGCKRNTVIRSYIQQHGEWPTQSDRRNLVEHIGGSFIFGSAVFKFIMGANTEADGAATPMDRLPLALKMNPGLDGLYAETLSRSKHLPHFLKVISTIALLQTPLPTSGIAEILGIHTYEVVNVLVNLQTIIQVPGTDDIPVTLCHTSLRDFLTIQSRSRDFFAHPSHHVVLHRRCLECKLKHLRQDPQLFMRPRHEIAPVARYAIQYSNRHSWRGLGCSTLSDFNSAIDLCREGLALQPGIPELKEDLANMMRRRGWNRESLADMDEAVSLSRAVLDLRPSSHPDRSGALNTLGNALWERYCRTGAMADLEEAISLYCGALELRPSPHPDRSDSLNNLGDSLLDRHRRTGVMADLAEAITLYREALELRPPPHPDRSQSLNNLGVSLLDRHQRTGVMTDLAEAIFLYREALELRPYPHPDRPDSLGNLGRALLDRHRCTWVMADLEEAISLHREALDLRPSPHPDRSFSLHNLGNAFLDRHRRTGVMADLTEAISLHRESLELRPSPNPDRSDSLYNLAISLHDMYKVTHVLSDLQEAMTCREELLELHYTVGHEDRPGTLRRLADLLQMHFDVMGKEEDLSRIKALREETDRLSEW